MTFPINVYAAAFLSAMVTALLSLPLWRKWCLHTGLVDDPGQRKIHSTAIPLAGGLAVLTGLLLPVLGAAALLKLNVWPPDTTAPLLHGLSRRNVELAAILLGAIAIVVLGFLDDKMELKPLPKFIGQIIIVVMVAGAGVRITLFVHNTAFSYAVTILWFLTLINAFNFMDNMNGLCTGLGAISALLFAVIAAVDGQYLVALIGFLMAGALLGFLPYNFPKASSFLGDAGSHLVGYLLAVLAILPHFYTKLRPHPWAVVSPLFVLAVPLFDLAWVVFLRWRMGRPFYIGDTNHLSHRFVRSGMSRTRAVLLIWFIAAVIGSIALL